MISICSQPQTSIGFVAESVGLKAEMRTLGWGPKHINGHKLRWSCNNGFSISWLAWIEWMMIDESQNVYLRAKIFMVIL